MLIHNNSKSENSLLKFWANHSGVVDKGQICLLLKYGSNLLTGTHAFWNDAIDEAYYEISTTS